MEQQKIIDEFQKNIWEHIEKHNNASANTFKKHLFKMAASEFSAQKLTEKSINSEGNILWDTMNSYRSIKHYIIDSSEKYHQHKQLFKNAFHKEGDFYFDPLKTEYLEELNDGINRIIHLNKTKKFAHSLVRSYKNLLNEQSYELFSNLMESDLTWDEIQQNIRKIASFNSTEDLNLALEKILSSGHTPETILGEIKNSPGNAHVAYRDSKIIIAEINDFEAAQYLASPQWCISDNESVFEDYLYQVPFGQYCDDELCDENSNEVRGQQFFAYDFTKGQDDPNHMIGFTLAANGIIVAAHNKNDTPVEKMLEQGELIETDIIKQVAGKQEHTAQQIKKTLFPDFSEEALNNPYYIISNSKNPLHVFISLCNDSYKEGEYKIIEQSGNAINIKDDLLNKSINDFLDYKQVSTSQFLNDMFDYHHFLKQVKSIQNKQQQEREIDECDEFYDEDFEEGIYMETNPHHIFANRGKESKFQKFIEAQLNDPVTVQILYIHHKQKIIDTLFHDIENNLHDINEMLIQPNASLMAISRSVLDHFAPQILDPKENEVNGKVKKTLALNHCLNNPNSKDHVENILIENVAKKEIHFNKILGNINQFSESLSLKAANYANNNPDCFENIKNETIQMMSHSRAFIDSLNKDACHQLNQAIHKNSLNFGDLKDASDIFSAKQQEFNFFERMSTLKEKGIIDEVIIKKHYNSARICFGDKEKEGLLLQSENKNKRIKPN